MSEPHKCDCQKLVIALLDRADALHREEVVMMECGHADAYSKLMKLQAENERLRKAGDDMAWALMGNPTVEAWNAAKGVQP